MRRFFIILLIQIVLGQINITAYQNYPAYTNNSNYIYDIQFNIDGSQIFLAVGFKVQRLNVSDPLNTILMGEYKWLGTQSYGYYTLIVVKDFLIGSSYSGQPSKIFNLTSYTQISAFTWNCYISSYKYIQSQNILVMGSNDGKFFYFDMNTFPNGSPVFVFNETWNYYTYMQKSYDEKYLSVFYCGKSIVRIFKLTDRTIVKTIDTGCLNSYQHLWSLDSRYLIVFPYDYNYLLVYDRDTNWTLSKNITTGYLKVRQCFLNNQTNTAVCSSQTNQTLFSINLYDFSVNVAFTGFQQARGSISHNNKVLTFYNSDIHSIRFFQIHQYCIGNTHYDIPTKNCVVCNLNCAKCSSASSCEICTSNYTLVNGTCSSNTISSNTTSSNTTSSNTTTVQNQTCLPHCDSCSSSSTCDLCAPNYNLVHFPSHSCVACPSGYIFNTLNETCGPYCTQNCQSCESSTECSVCSADFVKFKNKTCVRCGSRQTYDLVRDDCFSVSEQILENLMALTLQNSAIVFANKVPAKRALMSQIFAFFINIDHLWLYIYHKREYGNFMKKFLLSVRKLEQQKWDAVSEKFLSQKLSLNFTEFRQKLNFKINQTSQNYALIQNQSSSFLENTLEFFFVNFPLVLLTFIIFRTLNFFSSKFHISLFREYAFGLYFIQILMDRNVQSFSYFFMFDCIHLNSQNIFDKCFNLFTLLFFFILIIFIFIWYVMVKNTLQENAKYLFNNYHVNLFSSFHLTFECGIFNFCLGACHILMENAYSWQINTLLFIEIGFSIWLIKSVSRVKVYHLKYVGWQNLLSSLLRIILIFSFSSSQNIAETYQYLFNQIQMILLNFYLINWVLSILISYFLLFYQAFIYLKSKIGFKNQNRKIDVNYPKSIKLDFEQLKKQKPQVYTEMSLEKNRKKLLSRVLMLANGQIQIADNDSGPKANPVLQNNEVKRLVKQIAKKKKVNIYRRDSIAKNVLQVNSSVAKRKTRFNKKKQEKHQQHKENLFKNEKKNQSFLGLQSYTAKKSENQQISLNRGPQKLEQ